MNQAPTRSTFSASPPSVSTREPMVRFRVLGIDPSFRHFGVAKAILAWDGHQATVEDLTVGVCHTAKTTEKQVRVSSDNIRNARQIHNFLMEQVAWADVVISEIPTGAKSAKASHGFGICVGLLATIQKPLIEVSLQEVKKAAVGKVTASKKEIMTWAQLRYPDAGWTGVQNSDEHPADAIAAIHAGLKKDDFRILATGMGLRGGAPG